MELYALAFLVVLGCFIEDSQSQGFYGCGYLMPENCTTFPLDGVCGTDGVTYKNRCEFGQKHCSTVELHMKYQKACDPLDFMTTPHPTVIPTGTHGNDIVHNIFCAKIPYLPPPICPTGLTYENFCKYEKAKCMHPNLHVLGWGNCTN